MKPRPFKDAARRMRIENDWTQAEMAHRMGVSPRYYQSLEKGASEPSLAVVQVALTKLRVKYEEFFFEPSYAVAAPSFGFASKVLAALDKAPPARRAVVLSLLFRDASYIDALSDQPEPIQEMHQVFQLSRKIP